MPDLDLFDPRPCVYAERIKEWKLLFFVLFCGEKKIKLVFLEQDLPSFLGFLRRLTTVLKDYSFKRQNGKFHG